MVKGSEERDAIEPFEVAVADEVLDDLYRRVRTTRWPDDPLAADWTYGVPRALLAREAARAGESGRSDLCEASCPSHHPSSA